MARIRTLKPEFWTDEKLALMVPVTRLVFLGLVSQADDAGRLVDNVKLLDGLLFPYTDDSCAESLAELARLNRITRYRSESGQPLIQLVNWDKHQKVKNPSQYNLPAPSLERSQDPSVESGEGRSTVAVESNAPTVCRISYIPDPLPPTGSTDGGRANRAALMDEMVSDLTQHAEAHYPDPVKRRSFAAGARGVIAGEDATSWQDGSGKAAPWEDRPRIFRLALDRLAAGESQQLRGAVKWATAQQIDPDRVRPAIVGAVQPRDSPVSVPVANPADTLAKLQAEHPELYAEALAEFVRYPWWTAPETNDWYRMDQLRQAVKEKLARPRIVA